jgi:sulfoxide reductase heme-binding subunit YedZ
MAATSFDRTAAWLGRRPWRILHTAGMYYIWSNFMFAYGGRAFFSLAYAPLAALLVSAIALRLIASRKPERLAAARGA